MRTQPVAWGLVQLALLSVALTLAYSQAAEFFQGWDPDRPLQWWAARATGFAAYGAIALSMTFGLLISSRGLDGAVQRKTVTAYHQEWTLAALVVTLVHAAIVAADEYVEIGLDGALVPGRANHLTGAVALGTVALWLVVIIVASSWLRRLMAHRVWRAIHALASAAFILGMAHGVLAGTDTDELWARVAYAAGGALVLGATCFRLLYEPARRGGASRRAATSAALGSERAAVATSAGRHAQARE